MSLPPELKNCYLDHIAVAVENIEQALPLYADLGLNTNDHREVVESQKVETAFIPIDLNARIELLQPLGDEGPIYDFIQKKGPGIHHICLRVTDVVAKSKELKEKGYRLIYEQPTEGADNCLVNFVHPKSTGGILIEISQKKA